MMDLSIAADREENRSFFEDDGIGEMGEVGQMGQIETMQCHDCQSSRVERFSTEEEPFHYTGCGLPYVHLIGIKYYTCECGRVFAEIPGLNQLLQSIAEDIVGSSHALTGDEIRFLRKRLRKKSQEFAKDLGVDAETLLRMERGTQSSTAQLDGRIRALYCHRPSGVAALRPRPGVHSASEPNRMKRAS